MNLAVAAIVFGLVGVAELPDKTMIANIVMASRGRPAAVWVGATGAFAIHAALAVIAGRFLQLLPHRVLETIVAVAFGLGAIYLLLVPDKSERAKAGADGGAVVAATSAWRIALGSFGVILVGEMGDLTQLLMVNLEARYKAPVSVFIGGFVALAAAAAIGVFFGRALLGRLTVSTIRRIGGVALLGFCAYSVYTLVT
ncbi:MAG: TMEM165/GDT1 family protein [Acidimicrobiales bacterium]